MSAKISIFALGILFCAPLCKAQEVCPWINTATVIDAPDPAVGDVQSAVSDNGNLCTFRYRKADLTYSVQVTIHAASGNGIAANQKQCKAAKTTLNAIGNEAFLCSSEHESQAIGRVRDKIFVVDVKVKTAEGPANSTRSLADMATLFAEQVAGNLF